MPTWDSLPPAIDTGSGPLVSIIVPNYGDEAYILGAVESVAAQTHDAMEVVLVDSSGVDWLEEMAAEVGGVRYVYQEPEGPAAAFNLGVETATGQFVGFLGADDRFVPEKIERQLELADEGADVVYSDAYLRETHGTSRMTALPVTDPATHHVDFVLKGGVPHSTVIVRSSCLPEEPFDVSLGTGEDRHLLARLFASCVPAKVPEPLVYYERRDDSLTSNWESMYENEIAGLDDLLDEFEELRPYRRRLEGRALYKRGKWALQAGDVRAARRSFWEAMVGGDPSLKTALLFFVSLLPFGTDRAFFYLERVQERLR